MNVIVDANVAIKWFVREPGHDQALELLRHQDVEAPDLVVAELANLAWRKQRRGELTAAQAVAIAAQAEQAFTVLHPSAGLMARAAELAQQLRRPVYDCLYLACAAIAGTPLVTDDTALCRAVQGSALGGLVMPLRVAA